MTNKEYEKLTKQNKALGVGTLLFLAGVIIYSLVQQYRNPPMLSPVVEVKAESIVTVTPTPTRSLESIKSDPIAYIRYRGEELGIENEVIMTMIRIAKPESHYNPNARSKISTAAGLFQILIGTWENPYYRCTGDRYSIVDNTDCAYKIYQYQAGAYAKKGLKYEFSDWNESKFTKDGWGL